MYDPLVNVVAITDIVILPDIVVIFGVPDR
jgi:hypothetical protein